MSGFKSCNFFDPFSSLVYSEETSLFPSKSPLFLPPSLSFQHHFGFSLDLLNPDPNPLDLSLHCLSLSPSPFDLFDSAIDLIQIEKTPFSSTIRRLQHRSSTDLYLRTLCDRVSALELGFDRVLAGRIAGAVGGDRKYKWTAEIKGPEEKSGFDRKYKAVVDVKKFGAEKNYKWTTEIKGKDAPISHVYTLTASSGGGDRAGGKDKKKVVKDCKGSKGKGGARVVEIEEPEEAEAAIVLKKAFASRLAAAGNRKGKKKELSPQDAALIIQISFRAHLVRRSQVLCALRELALAKSKLKELRALFSNTSYRRIIAANSDERQRFAEKIIVLLLTVEDIQGLDLMVRAAKRSMVVELETMLDVVDPQPTGRLGSMKRRKFDLPENGPVNKVVAAGVSEVVRLIHQEDNASNAFTEVLA